MTEKVTVFIKGKILFCFLISIFSCGLVDSKDKREDGPMYAFLVTNSLLQPVNVVYTIGSWNYIDTISVEPIERKVLYQNWGEERQAFGFFTLVNVYDSAYTKLIYSFDLDTISGIDFNIPNID